VRSEVFVGLVLLGQLATTHLSVVALPLPYIIIIAHSVLFVKRFFQLFSRNFLEEKHLPLWEFTNLALLTLLSIHHLAPNVKHFGKNKKNNYFRKNS
jgi:signal transduction histidine kinase